MKIRFVIMHAFGIGGTIRSTLDTASRLVDKHDVEIISVNQRNPKLRFPVDPRVRVTTLVDRLNLPPERTDLLGRVANQIRPNQRMRLRTPSELMHPWDNEWPSFNVLTDERLRDCLREMRDGIVIGTRPSINLAIARLVHPSVFAIGQEHVYLDRWKPQLREAIVEHYRKLDLVTCLTSLDVEAYTREIGDSVPIRKVPNAVSDLGGVRTDLSNKVIVSVGRLSQEKGYDRLVPAFADVAAKHPEWTLKIFGAGREHEPLTKAIRELGMQDRIRLMGFSEDIPGELAAASAFVMSSRFEGFGLALLEAMAVGLPVVSFDCPLGPRDIVDHEVNGLLVPPGKVKLLGEALDRVMSDADLRERMSKAALEKAEVYSGANIGARWDQLIEEIGQMEPGSRRTPEKRPTWPGVPLRYPDTLPR